MGRQKKEKKPPTYKYYIRIGNNEPVDMDTLPKEEHDRICRQLADNFMAALGYERAKDQEAARIRHEENARKLAELRAQMNAKKDGN